LRCHRLTRGSVKRKPLRSTLRGEQMERCSRAGTAYRRVHIVRHRG
jgi:hypothetical protein